MISVACSEAHAQKNQYPDEIQRTFSAKNHILDNNDNYSANGRYLVYDTRETVGPGIENCASIEQLDLFTGEEQVLYAPAPVVTGPNAAPGVGAASYSPARREVAFIHGPPVSEVDERGAYAKDNRRGAAAPGDGSQELTWLDYRDVAADRPSLPGAHRGGTHRHEYAGDGRRIGFTYDDHLLPQYGRTIGYMEPHPDAPGDATHWFAVLVGVVPEDEAKPGDIVKAYADSWAGRDGVMRAFIGKVMEEDGSFTESLFVVDVPADADITTSDSGDAQRYPSPPEGVTVRRLTDTWAGGIVRGALNGSAIVYYAHDPKGREQLFLINPDPDPSRRAITDPVRLTDFDAGAGPYVRWHPTGHSVACITDNRIVSICTRPGNLFREVRWLSPPEDPASPSPERSQLVWSPDGSQLAYNMPVPAFDEEGNRVTAYDGSDFTQIFTIDFPDRNANGIAD